MQFLTMYYAFFFPGLAVIAMVAIVVTLIIVGGKYKTAKATAISQSTFEQLAKDIRRENADVKAELTEIKEKVSSMEKMMKDVE